ncbi:MAG TPA: hypothetical protein VJH94_04110 [Candidatus Paceibacterota bacterium]
MLVAEHPNVATAATAANRTSIPPDPFEGKPLARALHIAGMPITKSRLVRRRQERYRLDYCERETARRMGDPRCRVFSSRSRDEIHESLLRGTRWQTYSLEQYRHVTKPCAVVAENFTAEHPPIPSATDERIAEIQARVPGVEIEVEAFSRDPYVFAKLGTERLCFDHF